jgi:hypothetical protein
MSPVHGGDVQPCRGPGRLVAPALCAALVCVALLCVGSVAGEPHVFTTIRPTASTAAQALSEQPTPEDGPAEDLVTVPADRPYVWPSGIGLLVTAPTSGRRGTSAVARVRTTVLNGSAAPYDVYAVQGPTARYDGRDVQRIADSRFVQPTGEHIVLPGQRTTFETTFPAGPGRLTLQYRADFRYEAVVVDDFRPA